MRDVISKRALNRKEVAEMLGISVSTIRRLEKTGKPNPVQLSKRTLGFPIEQVEDFINKNIKLKM